MFENLNLIELIGQILGIFAMVFSILSLQMSTHKKIMIMQIITASFFAFHYLFIDEITGGVLNAVAIVRNIIFYNKDKKIFSGNWITAVFAVIMVGFGIYTWNGWYSVFTVVGMFFNTLSFSFTNPQSTRKTILIASPLVLIYNIFAFSIGGIINEFFSTISCLIAFIRYGKKIEKKEKENE